MYVIQIELFRSTSHSISPKIYFLCIFPYIYLNLFHPTLCCFHSALSCFSFCQVMFHTTELLLTAPLLTVYIPPHSPLKPHPVPSHAISPNVIPPYPSPGDRGTVPPLKLSGSGERGTREVQFGTRGDIPTARGRTHCRCHHQNIPA